MAILSDDLHRILDPNATLTLMGEEMLARIMEDPGQPFMERGNKGYGIEALDTYDDKISFLDICRQGKARCANRLDVAYDFFFGGDKRENYPDSPMTVKAYKIIHDIAREYGMGLAASTVSPLDIGGEFVRHHDQTGQTMQFQEGAIAPDGSYAARLDFQRQWTKNKGPAKLFLKEVKVFAFDEERLGESPFYYVDENAILDISNTAQYQVDPESFRVSRDGYGHGDIHIHGSTGCGRQRFLAVVVYRTQEIDYFADDALDYMKSILDLHKNAGITYDGIYSDEMHIQFDWDMREHWGKTEVTTRYMTDAMAKEYAARYGAQYRDFAKYLVYFTYDSHGFLEGEEGKVPAQHVLGRTQEDILRTFRFRRDYFEMLHRRVVDLCVEAKAYAETLFGKKMQATGHSTWQESPTVDSFAPSPDGREVSHYDYTDAFLWSAAQRENISACNDHFKWNEYFWAVGTDIPEGGFLDRNYYGAAYTAGLAALNPAEFAYYCIWGAPDQVKERLAEVGQTYGHYAAYCKSYEFGHHWIQGCTSRISDVLAVCPSDLNYLEERFGNWTVQYGYADYITEEKLSQYACPQGKLLQVKGRTYRAVVVFFSPLMEEKTLDLLWRYVRGGGTVLWCGMPAVGQAAAPAWQKLFGVARYGFRCRGIPAKGKTVRFDGFETVKDMPILTDLFVDYIYPVEAGEAAVAATLDGRTVGTRYDHPGGGRAVYMGLRVRDDQSCSTGGDVDTLFSMLRELGAYPEGSCEADSRPADRRYQYNRFPSGTVTLCNHFRTFREREWPGGFYRDEEKDDAFMADIALPPHDICLEGASIAGQTVEYHGEGIVSWRWDAREGLLAFGGRNTRGITIDGHTYQFLKEPGDLVWGKLPERIVGTGIREAWIFKCSRAETVCLPFDGSGMRCSLCRGYMLEPVEEYHFTAEKGEVRVTVDETSVGRWLVFYR